MASELDLGRGRHGNEAGHSSRCTSLSHTSERCTDRLSAGGRLERAEGQTVEVDGGPTREGPMPGEGARRHSVGAGEPSAVSEQGGDQSTVVGMEPGAASKPGQTDSGWGTPRDVEGLNGGGRRKGSEGAQCTETGVSGPGEGLGSRSSRIRLMTQRRGPGPPPAKRARVVLGLTFE